MARRGEHLRDHILWVAKDAFLELGFERTSMDEVARRAETSKRSLYAHFESKDNLFLAVIELVRGLFLGSLKKPEAYAEDPDEALTLFCSQYLRLLRYEKNIQMLRLSMAESSRFPEAAARLYDVIFSEVQARLSVYLQTACDVSATAGEELAQQLIRQLLYPSVLRALFDMDPLAPTPERGGDEDERDLPPIRRAVAELPPRVGRHSIEGKPASGTKSE